ncbi:MAG TPA: virulence protein RhuM/Fic/DOC family protein [Candidatus Bathyarchaeia archaeon]|nr:virulence protein RhuM/Fic/DOC family protein [Candidatus Bathyarchaeia archaeon]
MSQKPAKPVSESAQNNQIVMYKNRMEVRFEGETVWLSQAQMCALFGKDKRTVSEHIRNVFKEGELPESSVVRKFRTTAADGKSYNVLFYNLDVIISVGYRVKSQQGTQFRIWATQILKRYLIDGYTINEQRLKKVEEKYTELKKAVALIGNVSGIEGISAEAKGLAQVIADYATALEVLDDVDHERLRVPKSRTRSHFILTYEAALEIVAALKERFKDSGFVGLEKDQSFKGSLGAIYQTFGKKDLYPTVEEKASHLLYFVTKNHSFVDGNKRIAAALFVVFLNKNRMLYDKNGVRRIDDNALVALTLMVASSRPGEKEMIIKVILNLLAGPREN